MLGIGIGLAAKIGKKINLMDPAKTNQIANKITLIHRKHPWIRIYLLTLLVLIIWGNISTKIFIFTDNNQQNVSALSYENFAPGWASQGVVRSFLEPWQRWDTNFYLHIAKEGYSVSSTLIAFLPLYPRLIGLVAKLLGGQYLLAALLISWGAVFGSCFLLEERFTQMTDQKTAIRGIRNLLLFPTAFFFFAGYTEALFLFFLLLAWRYVDRGQWLLAGLVGAMATMTRFIGIVLVIPFGLIWLKNWKQNRIANLVPLLLLPIAYFGWGQFAKSIYKMSPFDAQTVGWFSHFDWPWAGVIGNLDRIIHHPSVDSLPAVMDLLAVLVVLFSIFWQLKSKLAPESVFMAIVIIISMTKITDSGLLGSVSRFVIPLFPIYLTLSELGENPKYDLAMQVLSITLWLLYSGLFFTWQWVA